MEGNETTQATPAPAANTAPEPRVLTTSLSHALQAGESGGEEERTASFDDIFAPPEVDGDSAESTGDQPPAATEPKKAQAKPADADILRQLAAEFGLNPAEPKHKALLDKMLAQQSSDSDSDGAQASDDDDDEYDALERQFFAEDEVPAMQDDTSGAPSQEQPQQQPDGGFRFGDVLDDTRTIEEAIERWREAFAEDDNGNLVDPKMASAVMNGIFKRQFAALAMPAVHAAIYATLQRELGDALGELHRARASQYRDQLYTGVLERLSKLKGYENLEGLFEKFSDKNIKVRNKEFPDTRGNRILQTDPWILDIYKQDQDPIKAFKKTNLARMQAMMRQWKKADGSFKLRDAQKLVQSGQEMERKRQSDGARQRLNAGPGATAAGAGDPADDAAWMNNIVKAGGGQAMRVADLLSNNRR